METLDNRLRTLLITLVVPLISGMIGAFSWAYAQDLPAVDTIRPVPRESALSPIVDENGFFVRPISGLMNSIDDGFIVIDDRAFRMAPSIRFLSGRAGFMNDRSNFMPGTFVEYLVNDKREVTAIWPSSGP